MPCDYTKYPPNWHTEIRPAVLKRANNCCEQCKVKNYETICRGILDGVHCYQLEDGKIYSSENGEYIGSGYVEIVFEKLPNKVTSAFTKVILTIAHLDHDNENNNISIDRLRALCQRCHLLYDGPKHAEKRKQTIEEKKGQIKLF